MVSTGASDLIGTVNIAIAAGTALKVTETLFGKQKKLMGMKLRKPRKTKDGNAFVF